MWLQEVGLDARNLAPLLEAAEIGLRFAEDPRRLLRGRR
jgi:hypothetical protein